MPLPSRHVTSTISTATAIEFRIGSLKKAMTDRHSGHWNLIKSINCYPTQFEAFANPLNLVINSRRYCFSRGVVASAWSFRARAAAV
jgi:hypothetical protein